MTTTPIMLHNYWPIENLREFKVHFASKNKHGTQPLDVFALSRADWYGWQEFRRGRDRFSRKFIFSLAKFYHETDTWLFGGVFQVVRRHANRYKVVLTDQGAPLIGRMKLRFKAARLREQNLDRVYGDFEIREILREPYTGREFPGLENLHLSFPELETIVSRERPDWKIRLQNVAGIYLISIGGGRRIQKYVGAAYGSDGVWSRWTQYAHSLHGGSAELRNLLRGRKNSREFCRKNFRIALLEPMALNIPEATVQAREGHWKEILQTRRPHGLNRN